MSSVYLDFERPIAELEQRIEDLRRTATDADVNVLEEVSSLEKRAESLREEIFSSLTRYQRVQLARHPRRPYTLDYVAALMTDYFELHGDRAFADDPAIVGGLAHFDGQPILVVGHQKGRDTKENLYRRFGMANPEGYRKALRLFELAGRFGIPILCLVDTPGAYPGIGAEERGQAEAIARNLREMVCLPVPVIVIVTGEGGSGGALAIAVGDVVLMLENSVYSVISPEGCASILWRDRSRNVQAADALRLAAQDLLELGVVDEIVPEPLGGAHRDPAAMTEAVGGRLRHHLEALRRLPVEELLRRRRAKFRGMGVVLDGAAPSGGR